VSDYYEELNWFIRYCEKEREELASFDFDESSNEIYFTARIGFRKMVETLLKSGANPNIKNNQGLTALSAMHGIVDTDVVNILKKAGVKQ
jgi:hypothetical protein